MSRRLKLTLFPLLFLFAAIFLGGSIGFGDDLASTDVAPLSTTAGANTTYTITFDNSDQAAPPPVNTPIPANGFISVEFPSGTDASNITAANVVFTSADGLTLGSVISFANTVLIYSTSAQDGSNSYVVTFTISNVNNLTTAGGPYNTTKIETYNSVGFLLDESFDDSVGFTIVPDALNSIVIEDAAGGAGSAVGATALTTDDTLQVWAAGYDQYTNFIADQSVTWGVTGSLDATPVGPAVSTTFAPSSAGTSGTITADSAVIVGSPDAVTGTISVGVGALASILVRDAAGGAGSAVGATALTTDDTLQVWAAGYDADVKLRFSCFFPRLPNSIFYTDIRINDKLYFPHFTTFFPTFSAENAQKFAQKFPLKNADRFHSVDIISDII